MIKKESDMYKKLDKIVCDVLRNIDAEYKSVDKNGNDKTSEKIKNEKVYKNFFELFSKESDLEVLTLDELVETYKDKNVHKYLFYMFESLLNKISISNNIRYLDFLFLILRYITYMWIFLSNDDKRVLIFYYYYKFVDLLFNLSLVRCSFFMNMYIILIYFYMKDKKKKKKITFIVKNLSEKEVGFHTKNVISELNKIIINENIYFIKTISKENDFVFFQNESIQKRKEEKNVLSSNEEEYVYTITNSQNLYNYLWVSYSEGENLPIGESKYDIHNIDKRKLNPTKEEKSFVFITKCQNFKNIHSTFLSLCMFSINNTYNIFLNFMKNLFKISVYDFSAFFPFLSSLNMESLFSHFHFFEILYYVQIAEANSEIGSTKKETKIVTINSSCSTPYILQEQANTKMKKKFTNNECIFSNNNMNNKKILWNTFFDELKKIYAIDTKNVNYTLKILKYTLSFFLFEEKILLKNREWSTRLENKKEHSFPFISQIYLKEVLKFSHSYINNLVNSRTLNEEVLFKAISYIFYLLSKLICNINNSIKKYILQNNYNNLTLIAIITYIYKYFKRVYMQKSSELDMQKRKKVYANNNSSRSSKINSGCQNKLKYEFITLEKIYQKIQECLYIILTIDEFVEGITKKRLSHSSSRTKFHLDTDNYANQYANSYDIYSCIIIKINKMNMFYSNLDIIKMLLENDKNIFRKYIYTINKNNENFVSFFSHLLNIDYNENHYDLVLKKYISNLKEKKNYKSKKLIKLMKPYHSPLKYIILKNEIDQTGLKKVSTRKSIMGINLHRRHYDAHAIDAIQGKSFNSQIKRKSMYEFGRNQVGVDYIMALEGHDKICQKGRGHEQIDNIQSNEGQSDGVQSDEEQLDEDQSYEDPSDEGQSDEDSSDEDQSDEDQSDDDQSDDDQSDDDQSDDDQSDDDQTYYDEADYEESEPSYTPPKGLRIYSKRESSGGIKRQKLSTSNGKREKKDMPIFENSILRISKKKLNITNIDFKSVCHSIVLSIKRCILITDSMLTHFKTNQDFVANFNIYVCKNIFVNFLRVCLLSASFFSYICVKLNYDDMLKQIYDLNLIIMSYNIFDKYISFILDQDIEKLRKLKNVFHFSSNLLNKNNTDGNFRNYSSSTNAISSTITSAITPSVQTQLCREEIYNILKDHDSKKESLLFLSDQDEFIETVYLNIFMVVINIVSVWEMFLEIPAEVLNKMKYTFFELFYNTTIKIIKFIKKDKGFLFLLNILKYIYTKFISLPFNPINIDTTIKLYDFYEFLINDNYENVKKEEEQKFNSENVYMNSISPLKFLNKPESELCEKSQGSVHKLDNIHDDSVYINPSDYVENINNDLQSINKKKRVSIGGLIPVFLNNTNRKKRKTNIDEHFLTLDCFGKSNNCSQSTTKKCIFQDNKHMEDKIDKRIKYDLGENEFADENANVTPKHNYDNTQNEENKDKNNFRKTYLSNYYIPHIYLLFIIVDLEVFHYFEKKGYKKVIIIVENVFNNIVHKCDYNTKEYLRSSISHIYNYYQQVYFNNIKINTQNCAVIRHIFNLYTKSKVFYLSKKIKKKLLYYKNSYNNDDMLKLGYNKIYNNFFSNEEWKNYFYFTCVNMNIGRNKKMKMIDNLLLVHINILLFLIFYEHMSKYVTKKFIFFFQFFCFFFNKLCIDILNLVSTSNHLEYFNIFNFQKITNSNHGDDDVVNKLKSGICQIENCFINMQNDRLSPHKLNNTEKRKTQNKNKKVIMMDIDELLVTYIQLNFIFCRSCCFFVFFKNVCSQKYEMILKENITNLYLECFKNNRDFFDLVEFINAEKKGLEYDHWREPEEEEGPNTLQHQASQTKTKKLNDFIDQNSEESCKSNSSTSSLSQSSFTLIEYTNYTNNVDYIFLEFILEKIEGMDVDYLYRNALKNCYYVIKIEIFYNYIYKNVSVLKRFSYLNNLYYLYKLYYHMFVLTCNQNHFKSKKNITTEEKMEEKKLSRHYDDILSVFHMNGILKEKICSSYVQLIDHSMSSFFSICAEYPKEDTASQQYYNSSFNFNKTEKNDINVVKITGVDTQGKKRYRGNEHISYIFCNIYNFRLKLFHPLNFEKSGLGKGRKKSAFTSSLTVNRNYLTNLKDKYVKMIKYMDNYLVYLYYIVLYFHFNEYDIDRNKLSFHYIICAFQNKFDKFNSKICSSFCSHVNVPLIEDVTKNKNEFFYNYPFQMYTEKDLMKNTYLIFEILNNIYEIYHSNIFENPKFADMIITFTDIKIIAYFSEIYKISFFYKMYHYCLKILILCLMFTSRFWLIYIFNGKYEYEQQGCRSTDYYENNEQNKSTNVRKEKEGCNKKEKNINKVTPDQSSMNGARKIQKEKYYDNDIMRENAKSRRRYILNEIYNKIVSNMNDDNLNEIYNNLHNYVQLLIVCISIFYLSFLCSEKIHKNMQNIIFLNCANNLYNYYVDFYEYVQKFCQQYCLDNLYTSNFFFDNFHLDLINLKLQAHVRAKRYKKEFERMKKMKRINATVQCSKNTSSEPPVALDCSNGVVVSGMEKRHKCVIINRIRRDCSRISNMNDGCDREEAQFLSKFSYLFRHEKHALKECVSKLRSIEKKYESDSKNFFKNNICLYFNMINCLYKKKRKYISLLLFTNSYIISIVTLMKFTMAKYFSFFNITSDFFSLKFEHPTHLFYIDMFTKIKKSEDGKENNKLTNKAILLNLENLFCNMFLNKDMLYHLKFVYTYHKKISKIMHKMNNFFLSYYYLKKNILFISDLIYLPEIVHSYILLTNIILKCGKERIELLTQEEIFFENLNNELSLNDKKILDQDIELKSGKDKTVKDVNDFKIYEDVDFMNIDYVKTPLNTYLTKRHIYMYRKLLTQFMAYLIFLVKNPDHMFILCTKHRREILYVLSLIIFTKKVANHFSKSTVRPKKSKDSSTLHENAGNFKGNTIINNKDNGIVNLREEKSISDTLKEKGERGIQMTPNCMNKNENTYKIKDFEKDFLTCFNKCNEKKEQTFFNFFLEKLFILSNLDTDLFNIELDSEEPVEDLITSHVMRDITSLDFARYECSCCHYNLLTVENSIWNEKDKSFKVEKGEIYQGKNEKENEYNENYTHNANNLYTNNYRRNHYSFKINDIAVLNYLYLNYDFEINLTYIENYINNRLFILNCKKMNSYFIKILLYYMNLIFLKIKNIFCDDCIYTIKKQQFLNSSANDCSSNIFFFLFLKLFHFFNFSNRIISELCANYFPGNKNYDEYLDLLSQSKKNENNSTSENYTNDETNPIGCTNITKNINKKDDHFNKTNNFDKMLFINFVEIFLYPTKNCSYLEVLTVCYEFLVNMKDYKTKELRNVCKHKMYEFLIKIIIQGGNQNNSSIYYFQTILLYLSLLLYNTCKKTFVHEMRKVAQFFLDFVYFFIENIKNNLIILQIIEAYGEEKKNLQRSENANDLTDNHNLENAKIEKQIQVNLLKFYFRKLLSLLHLYTDELIFYTIKNNIDQEISQKNYYRKHAHEDLNIDIIRKYEYICETNFSEFCFYWDYAIVSMSHDKCDLYISRCFKNFLFVLIRIIKEGKISEEESSYMEHSNEENKSRDKKVGNCSESYEKKQIFSIEGETKCFNFYEKMNNLLHMLKDEDIYKKLLHHRENLNMNERNTMSYLSENVDNYFRCTQKINATKYKKLMSHSCINEKNKNHLNCYKRPLSPSSYITNDTCTTIKRGEEEIKDDTITQKNEAEMKDEKNKAIIYDEIYLKNAKNVNEELRNEYLGNIFFTCMLENTLGTPTQNNKTDKTMNTMVNSYIAPLLSGDKNKTENEIELVRFFLCLYKSANNCINRKTHDYFHVDKVHLNIEKFTFKEKWNYIKKLEKILKQYQHMIKIMCEILHESKNVDRNRSNLKIFIDLWWNNRYTLEQHLRILNLDISNVFGFSIHKLMSIPLISLNIRRTIELNKDTKLMNSIGIDNSMSMEKSNTYNMNSAYNTLSLVNNQKYYLQTNFDLFVVLYYYSNMLNIISWINKWEGFFLPLKHWDDVNYINILLNLTVFSIVLKNCNVQITHVKRKYLRLCEISVNRINSSMENFKGRTILTSIGSTNSSNIMHKTNHKQSKNQSNHSHENITVPKNLINMDKNVVTSYLPFINKDIETILLLDQNKKYKRKSSTASQIYSSNINLSSEGKKRMTISYNTHDNTKDEIQNSNYSVHNKKYSNIQGGGEKSENIEAISSIDNQYKIVIPKGWNESSYENSILIKDKNSSSNYEYNEKKKGRRRTINLVSEKRNSVLNIYGKNLSINEKEKKKKDEKKVGSTMYSYLSPLKGNNTEQSKNKIENDIIIKQKKNKKRITVAGTLNLNHLQKQDDEEQNEGKEEEKKGEESIYLKYLDLKKKCDKGVLKCSFLKLRMYLYNILIDIFENNHIHPKDIFNCFNIITHSFVTDIIKCTIVEDAMDRERYTYVRSVENKRIRKNPVVIYIHNNLNRLPFENLEPLKDSYLVRGVHRTVTAYLYERVLNKIKMEEKKRKGDPFSNHAQQEMDEEEEVVKEVEENEMDENEGGTNVQVNNYDNKRDSIRMLEHTKQECSENWKTDFCKSVFQRKSIQMNRTNLIDSQNFEDKKKNEHILQNTTNDCTISQMHNAKWEHKNISENKENKLSYNVGQRAYDSMNADNNSDNYQRDPNLSHVKAFLENYDRRKLTSKIDSCKSGRTHLRTTLVPSEYETMNISGEVDINYGSRIAHSIGRGRYSLIVSNNKAKGHNEKRNSIGEITNGESGAGEIENLNKKENQSKITKKLHGKVRNKKNSRKSTSIEQSFLNPFNNNSSNKKGTSSLLFDEDEFNGKDKVNRKSERKTLYDGSKKEGKCKLGLLHSANKRRSVKNMFSRSSCPSNHSLAFCHSPPPSSSESASSVELIQDEDELRKIFMNARRSMNIHNIMSYSNNNEYSLFCLKKKKKKKSVSESEAYFDEEKFFLSSYVECDKKERKRRSYSADPEHHSKMSKIKYVKYVPYYMKSSRLIDPKKSNIFFVINPNGDLKRTEDATYPFIYFKNKEKYKYKNWNGYFGKVPCEKTLLKHLCCDDLYLYCGHQGGEQYIKKEIIQNAILSYSNALLEDAKNDEEKKEGILEKEKNHYTNTVKCSRRKTNKKENYVLTQNENRRKTSCYFEKEKRTMGKDMKSKCVENDTCMHGTSNDNDVLYTQTEIEDEEEDADDHSHFSTNKNDGINSCVFLIGCSSGLLSSHGFDLDVWGTPYDYIVGGCIFVFGNLWNVTDGEVDGFTQNFFWKWTQPNSSSLFSSNSNYSSVQMINVSTFDFRNFAKMLLAFENAEIDMNNEGEKWGSKYWRDGDNDDLLIDVGDNFITLDFDAYTYLKKKIFFSEYFQKYYHCNITLNQNLFNINQNRKYTWLSMTEALAEAKQFCRLPNTTGSAVVIYGLPL
ncbi:hypothetical protein, conserved [Plasmodium gonderi]|uniref:separase n=1 Tax=Plasmodium gonderi TaxID=77519 RepID=A0A1Y1JRN8_PLAGO|nr:hypothetical protein, conserved [Plasmodium gonderi]GAW83502.1 hypothetical protein, conserved [Plasmodium gonderi]